jgi:hypothetical protein
MKSRTLKLACTALAGLCVASVCLAVTIWDWTEETEITSLWFEAWDSSSGVPNERKIAATNLAKAMEFAASQTVSGTFAAARLGSGTPSSSTYLRGDGAWAALGSGTPDSSTYLRGDGVWATPAGGSGGGGGTNMMVSTITYGTTISPTFAIGGLSTTAASCRRVTFRLTLTGNVTTVNAPAGTLIDGDTMIWEIIQDGTGGRTIAGWDVKYVFGSDISGITLSTGINKRDFMTATYNSTADKWYVTGFVRGY